MNDLERHKGVAPRTLARPARAAERRLRMQRAFEAGTTALAVAFFASAVVMALLKTGHLREGTARVGLLVALLGAVLAATVAYLRPLAARAGAVALDRHYGLSDRIASALSFSELPAAERTPFMDLAIEDGVRAAEKVAPRRAVPFRPPRDVAAAAGLLCALVVISLFEVRRHVPVAVAKTIDAVDVTSDDLDAMREFLKEQSQKDTSEATKAAVAEFNQLIEDLAQHRLDRTEAFRKMQALEDKLLEGREADKKALEDALARIGEELKKTELSKPAGEALEAKNLPKASEELRKLADKLREKGGAMDKAELDKLRAAIKEAAEDNARRQQALAQRREELQNDLLKEKQKRAEKDGGADEEKSLLQKKERELERLNREFEQADSAQRKLDRLDRELNKAAEDLMKDLGASANDLEQGAEDINHIAQEEMSQEEKEQLKQKLEELREMLRQQGQGGQQQMVRLRRFQNHAKGQRGQGQQGQGQGQEGQGQEGEGEQGQGGQGQQGQNGQGQNGQGQQGQNGQGQQGQNGQGQGKPDKSGMGGGSSGQGQNGQGQGGQGQSKGGELWVVGPNGEKILMLSRSSGGGQNGGGGEGEGQATHSWGTGHDEHVQKGATKGVGGTEDTQVEGQDTGQGTSRSEVIQGAAERGFASKGYTKVYREYHAVAEEALGKDEIPGGYRFYVKRYFQLIRPRE